MQPQITSIFNGKTYGTRNGKFSAHLKQNDITYQEYFEKYISGSPAPTCPYCDKARKFLAHCDSYRDTCGTKECTNKAIRQAHLSRSDEAIAASTAKRKKTVLAEYGVDSVTKLDSVQRKLRESEKRFLLPV